MAQRERHVRIVPEVTVIGDLEGPVALRRQIGVSGGDAGGVEDGVGREIAEVELTDLALRWTSSAG